MANFELRIYSIPSENFDEICEEKKHTRYYKSYRLGSC